MYLSELMASFKFSHHSRANRSTMMRNHGDHRLSSKEQKKEQQNMHRSYFGRHEFRLISPCHVRTSTLGNNIVYMVRNAWSTYPGCPSSHPFPPEKPTSPHQPHLGAVSSKSSCSPSMAVKFGAQEKPRVGQHEHKCCAIASGTPTKIAAPTKRHAKGCWHPTNDTAGSQDLVTAICGCVHDAMTFNLG